MVGVNSEHRCQISTNLEQMNRQQFVNGHNQAVHLANNCYHLQSWHMQIRHFSQQKTNVTKLKPDIHATLLDQDVWCVKVIIGPGKLSSLEGGIQYFIIQSNTEVDKKKHALL